MAGLRSRTDGLVVEELDGGLVVYDGQSSAAHWLDEDAARVWRACGETVEESELALAAGLDAASCATALEGLLEVGLVVGEGVTRRVALGRAARVGAAGTLAAPLVSVVLPAAAAHASTTTMGGPGGSGGQGGGSPAPQLVLVPGESGETDEGIQNYSYTIPSEEPVTPFQLINLGQGASQTLLLINEIPGQFEILGDGCTGESLASYGFCSFDVLFQSLPIEGPSNGMVQITGDDGTQYISLSLTGLNPGFPPP